MFDNLSALTEEDKKKSDFKPLEKGLYILTVKEYEIGETDDYTWQGQVKVPTGEKMGQLILTCWVSSALGAEFVKTTDGKDFVNPKHRIWLDKYKFGWNKKDNKPKEGRAVLSALLKRPKDGDINFGSPEELLEKRMMVYMGINEVTGKNVMVDIDPMKE